jgi:serine/threonine-protein kinase RsbW
VSDAEGVLVVELPSELGMATVARAAVRALLESARDVRLDEREMDEVGVVVHEACTNALRHAHGLDPRKRFRVEVVRRPDEVEIRVSDEGAPFQLSDGPAPAPELLHEGGYGVHIMRTWMDEVSVQHDGRGNVLRLVRRYRRASATRGGALARGV